METKAKNERRRKKEKKRKIKKKKNTDCWALPMPKPKTKTHAHNIARGKEADKLIGSKCNVNATRRDNQHARLQICISLCVYLFIQWNPSAVTIYAMLLVQCIFSALFCLYLHMNSLNIGPGLVFRLADAIPFLWSFSFARTSASHISITDVCCSKRCINLYVACFWLYSVVCYFFLFSSLVWIFSVSLFHPFMRSDQVLYLCR